MNILLYLTIELNQTNLQLTSRYIEKNIAKVVSKLKKMLKYLKNCEF